MRRLARLALAVAPLFAVPLVFVAVLRSNEPAPWARARLPDEPHLADRCNWHCHNHGCRHRPSLPLALSGDRGLFGATVSALHAVGDAIAPRSPGIGYGVANLALFCVAWPGLMFVLWLLALRQRRQIREIERRAT